MSKWITENFSSIEAIAVRDLGLRDAEDQVIFFSARNADATVMTKDSDFLELQKDSERRQKLSGSLAGILQKLD